MTIDSKAREAAAQTIDPSGIFGLTWQECLERAEAAITAYLNALPPPKVEEAEPVAWRWGPQSDGWQFTTDKKIAEYAIIQGCTVVPLYAYPSPVLADEGVIERAKQILSKYAAIEPEDDETWESWYRAAFDMAEAEITALSPPAVTP